MLQKTYSSSPFFSIIIPAYNRADRIIDTLESIKAQSFKDYELIIVDDGSTDNSKESITQYIASNNCENWHYHYKVNGERGAARNYGISKASGKWITFLDSDDRFYPDHLLKAKEFIEHTAEIKVFHSAYEFKNEQSGIVRKIKYPSAKILNEALVKGNIISCFGVFVSNSNVDDLRLDEAREGL